MAYNIFREEFVPQENVGGIKKRKPQVVYSRKKQTGKRIDIDADRKRTAMPPGKRISKKGKTYYEYRKNRTDFKGLNI